MRVDARGMKCPKYFTGGRPWISSKIDGIGSRPAVDASLAIANQAAFSSHTA